MNIEEVLNKAVVKRQSSKELLEKRQTRKQELAEELETVLKSQVLLQSVAEEVQSKLSVKINNIVNLGLETCFPEYTFELQYVPARGKTEVRFVFKKDNDEVDILNQNGGGLVDLACFTLRIAVYALSSTDNVIVLDEPFRFVSKSLRPKIAELMETLSEKMNIQFIYVTHIDELSSAADKEFRFRKQNNVSALIEV